VEPVKVPIEPVQPWYQCQNCQWEGRENWMNPIKDLHQRVAPGEPMPAGECPKCGALCYNATK
jgi:hypothetical protein